MREVTQPRTGVPRQPGPRERPGGHATSTEIYVTERTTVRRVFTPGVGTVIVKQALGPEAVRRIQHERAILERLATVTGVPHLAGAEEGDSLVLEDLGGRCLAEILDPPDTRPPDARSPDARSPDARSPDARSPDAPSPNGRARDGRPPSQRRDLPPAGRVLQLGIQLADILARVHAAGVVHRDLNPANILIDTAAGRPGGVALVDFDLATTFAQVRPTFVDGRQILGRLAYLAPEQTGRTALGVDQRTDLYALGATLYELLTGRAPFLDPDPLRLIGEILTADPVPVGDLVEGVPATLSEIVGRLLEKQADARYQSAAGLAHDLRAVADAPDAELVLGERDYPAVLSGQRLVGREQEVEVLTRTLDQACRRTGPAGAQRLLVHGPPGVGKSELIQQLRPAVTARGGWFVSGKADQFQQDARASVFVQAMDALGHQLLTQPEDELAMVRARLAKTLGDSAGLVAGLVPSIGRLLGVEPESRSDGDPVTTRARITQAAPALLAGVASADHPVVVLLDDLQWAGTRAMDTIDALFADTSLQGLVIIGAYRPEEVDAAHPLTAMISRWERSGRAPLQLPLGELAPQCVGELVSDTLRVAPPDAAPLAALLTERAHGNPYDTIEFLNALRDGGVLTLGPGGWSWDEDRVRRHIGSGDVLSLLTQRLDRLPLACRQVLQAMSCLGTAVDPHTLSAACAAPVEVILDRLAPALEDGLLVAVEDGAGTQGRTPQVLRFRHDRLQQAAHGSIPAADRTQAMLQIARRLVAHGAELEACALYRDLLGAVTDPRERQDLVPLFLRAARAARRTVNPGLVESYLACAAGVHERAEDPTADAAGLEIDVAWHEALYELGRLTEADEVYRRIEAAVRDPIGLVPSACIQMVTMTNRGQLADALAFGASLLQQLGVPGPGEDLAAQVRAGYERTGSWIETVTVEADLSRPPVTDPRLAAVALVMATMCSTAYFSDHLLLGWLVTKAQQLWAEHGPQAQLVPVLGHSNAAGLGMQPDRQLDRRVVLHALAIGEARRYEPMTARTHFLNTVVLAPWFEPMEQVLAEARAAREVLVRHGDLQNGCYSYYSSVYSLMECAPSLDLVTAELDAAIAMATRLGNPTVLGSMLIHRQLVRALQGRTDSTDSFTGDGYDEDSQLHQAHATGPMVVAHFHLFSALRDLIFDCRAGLSAQLETLPGLLPIISGTYVTAIGDLLLGLHAVQAIDAGDGDPVAHRGVLDGCHARLARAAQRSGANFGHLAALLAAERARLDHDIPGALAAFDEALGAADQVARPWHQALAHERAAGFLHELGARQPAVHLLAEARERYRNWGASAKVRNLEGSHPDLRRHTRVEQRVSSSTSVTSETLDMTAILAASQAIGSQTDPNQLHEVLVEQLKTLTGARSVAVALPGEPAGTWTVQPGSAGGAPVSVEEAGRVGAFPLTAFRYVCRLRQPLVTADAVHDGRFSTDPFFSGMDRCSLLAVPIISGAALRAVLILSSGGIRGAFSSAAQASVRLVAGQLAVSIDNARLYRSLEEKVELRTRDLEAATRQLEELSLTDALTLTGNRRRFDQAIATAGEGREARPLTVILADIDHFKQYNDVKGHQAGDECLRSVAAALSGGLRDRDLVCRYGGEEFAIIAPGLTAEMAPVAAERARRRVVALGLDHPSNGCVTVSLGVATADAHTPADVQTLVAAADAALYRAKDAGRNRVEVAEPGPAGSGRRAGTGN